MQNYSIDCTEEINKRTAIAKEKSAKMDIIIIIIIYLGTEKLQKLAENRLNEGAHIVCISKQLTLDTKVTMNCCMFKAWYQDISEQHMNLYSIPK